MKKTSLALIIITLLITPEAHAYLDGGTGGMLLQLLFGGIAGLLMILKLYWHKILNFFSKKNANIDKSNNISTKKTLKTNKNKS